MKAEEKFFKASVAIVNRIYSEMYNHVLRKNTNPKMVLREFQQAVSQVHRWTPSKQKVEFEKALRFEQKYEKLIMLNVRASVKSVIPADRVKYAMEEVPDPETFFHQCLVEVSREMYRYPSLMYHNVDTFARRKNREQIKDLIHGALDKVLLDIIPILSDSESEADHESVVSTCDEDEGDDASPDGPRDHVVRVAPLHPVALPPAVAPPPVVQEEPVLEEKSPEEEAVPSTESREEPVESREEPVDDRENIQLPVESHEDPVSPPDHQDDFELPVESHEDPVSPPDHQDDSELPVESHEDPVSQPDPHEEMEEPREETPSDPTLGSPSEDPEDPVLFVESLRGAGVPPDEPDFTPEEQLDPDLKELHPDHISIDIPESALKKKNPRLTSLALSLVSPDGEPRRYAASRMSYEPFSDSESERDISVKTSDCSDDLCDEPLEDLIVTSDED